MSEAFDFRTALERIEATARAIEGGEGLSPERRRQVLEARARRWARPPATQDADPRVPLVVFQAGGHTCGVEPSSVREVLRPCLPTPLPGDRPFLSGVIHNRGDVLAVIDVGAMAGSPAAADRQAPAPVVVVEARGQVFGIRADSVPEMASALADDAGAAGIGHPGTLPASIRRTATGALLYLDLEALAGDPRIVVDEASR